MIRIMLHLYTICDTVSETQILGTATDAYLQSYEYHVRDLLDSIASLSLTSLAAW